MRRLVFIIAVFHWARGNMTVTPRNTVVLAGDRVELKCGVDRNSTIYRWEVSKPSPVFKIETIFRLDKNSGSAAVNRDFVHLGIDVDNTGSGIIYYNSTDLGDAGNYTCRASIGHDQEKILYSAQLIVLESLPNCTSSYDNENDSSVVNITMQCSLNFRGFWSPTMQWKQHDANGKCREVEVESETRAIPTSHVTSSLTVRLNSLGAGTFFSCKTYFERTFDGILIMNATNIPDFVYVWVSPVYNDLEISSRPMEQTDQTQVLWWFSICVALPLLAVFLAVICAWKKRKPINKEKTEDATYAKMIDSQISTVDLPPKTRPRLRTMPFHPTTCIPQPDDQMDTSAESLSQMEPVHGCLATVTAMQIDDLRFAEAGPIYYTLEPIDAASIVESQEPTME